MVHSARLHSHEAACPPSNSRSEQCVCGAKLMQQMADVLESHRLHPSSLESSDMKIRPVGKPGSPTTPLSMVRLDLAGPTTASIKLLLLCRNRIRRFKWFAQIPTEEMERRQRLLRGRCVTAESASTGTMHRPAGLKACLPEETAVWAKPCSKLGAMARDLMAGASIFAPISGTLLLLQPEPTPIFIRYGHETSMKSCLGFILHQAYRRNGWQRSGWRRRTVR